MSIQVLSYKGKSFISKLIEWQTRSPYSHIAMRFTEAVWVKHGEAEKYINAGNVIEAWTGSVRLVDNISSQHTPFTPVDVFEFVPALTRKEESVMASFLVRQLGKPYDYVAICRFITREPVNHWVKDKWFCSELIFEAALTAGRHLLERVAAWQVSPRDLVLSPGLRLVKHEVTRSA